MADEVLSFDGIQLNDSGGTWMLEEFNTPPPRKRMDWVQSDSHGSTLVREPLYDNRVITVKLQMRQPAASMELALDAIGALVDKVEECSSHDTGLPLAWSPAGSGRTVYFDVLAGEVTELPVTIDSGWFQKAPSLTMELTCKPFWRGTVQVSAEVGSGAFPYVAPYVSNQDGDAPAEATLVIRETANVARNDVEWGLEHRYYNPANPAPLLIDSSSFVYDGIATAATDRTGRYGSNTAKATIPPVAALLCSLGDQIHIGTFRIKARVWTDSANVLLRFAWRDGDGAIFSNPWAQPLTQNAFSELDLGTITIGEAAVGTQRWTGQFEAYSLLLDNPRLDIDYIFCIPCGEAYGRATAPLRTNRTLLIGQDSFNQSAGSVTGKTMGLGGTWAAPGSPVDADDFTVGSGYHIITRTAISDGANLNQGRIVLAGTTVMSGTEALVDHWGDPAGNGVGKYGLILRYVDTSNFLVVYNSIISNPAAADPYQPENNVITLAIVQVVAGTATNIGNSSFYHAVKQWCTLHVWADPEGRVLAVRSLQVDNNLGKAAFGDRQVAVAQDAVLASGGALDDGRVGIYDQNTSTVPGVRSYDNFLAYQFERQPVLNATKTLLIRSDDVLRENANGYYGRPSSYQGARFRLPPDGDQNRISRVFVKARRNVTSEFPDENISDTIAVHVEHTPRGVVVPR